MVTRGFEISTVLVAVVLSISAALSVVSAFPSHSLPSTPQYRILTPASPVLLPQGATYPTGQGSLYFQVGATVDLQGSWRASSPIALAVFSLPFGATTWPSPGSFVSNGSLSLTLFPGTYAVVFVSGVGESASPVLTVTNSILAQFDRGLAVLQPREYTELPAGGYFAWAVPVPAISTGLWLNGTIAATACSDRLAILPGVLYEEFQQNRSVIYTPGALGIGGGTYTPCQTLSKLQNVGLAVFGPFSVTPGERVVFYNAGPNTAQIAILAPLEVSYLTVP